MYYHPSALVDSELQLRIKKLKHALAAAPLQNER
jgi:hypothetical protein